jgi:hypothetical protein
MGWQGAAHITDGQAALEKASKSAIQARGWQFCCESVIIQFNAQT